MIANQPLHLGNSGTFIANTSAVSDGPINYINRSEKF